MSSISVIDVPDLRSAYAETDVGVSSNLTSYYFFLPLFNKANPIEIADLFSNVTYNKYNIMRFWNWVLSTSNLNLISVK